jgi:excisionase family DNA binding protein
MRKKPLSKTTCDIQARFFEAIDMLIAQMQISSLDFFCYKYGLLKPKYYQIKSGKNQNDSRYAIHIDIDALTYLVCDYDVSAEWLLTGEGGMFKNRDIGVTSPLYMVSYDPQYGKEHEAIPPYDRITLQEACEFLNKSKNQVYQLTHNKNIPYGILARKIVFSKHELQHWMKTQINHKKVLVS